MSGVGLSLVGGSVAALCLGTSAVAAARISRDLGAYTALAWVQVFGLLVIVPVAIMAGGFRSGPAIDGLMWILPSAVPAVVAVYLMYEALRRGAVAIVMPLVAMQGVFAAVLAVTLGESLTLPAIVGLLIAACGTFLVVRKSPDEPNSSRASLVSILLASACAAVGTLALFGSAGAGAELGVIWVLLAMRVLGVLGITMPMALSRRLTHPRGNRSVILYCAVADLVGFGSYILASSQGSVTVSAVLVSQFATIAVLGGVILYRERLTPAQIAGVTAVLVGVTLLAGSTSA
jgi:drug/metabolite transporter (DMT)-like permease